jgi:CheY-like chemotaxis protein
MPSGRKWPMYGPVTQPLRLLVVDDHGDTVIVFRRLLEQEGHRVAGAVGFADAMTAARAGRFDVLLCNIGWQPRDGCDLLAEVRSLYPVRAIAISGYESPEHVKRAMDAGFDQFIAKPAKFSRVLAALAIVAIQIEGDRDGFFMRPTH